MPTHAHHPRTSSPDVVGGKHQIDQGRLDEVVVVAPDDPFFVGVHGMGTMTRGLGFVSPFGCLLELVHRDPGNATGLFKRHSIGLNCLFKRFGMGRDKFLVMPFLVNHVGQQTIEQGDIRSRFDIHVKHVVFARRLLGHSNGGCPAGVDKNHLGWSNGFPRKALLTFIDCLPLQVGKPVRQEIVGLGFV
ncbi:hypothetical protein D3C85_916050 [compost metagenome]